jgi:hypothetical protein
MDAATIRAEASALVRRHAGRLGLEEFAVGALARAIEALPADASAGEVQSWQPMETVHKDGRWVVLTGGELNDQRDWEEGYERRPVVAKWVEKVSAWWREGWFVSDFDSGYGLGLWYENPTHWMPLPGPPAAAESECCRNGVSE